MIAEAPLAAFAVFAGALGAGVVAGLTGFGTGLTALPIWIHVLPPVLASPLVVVCSLVAQVQTLPAIWHAIDVRRLMPYVICGLLGVPLGAMLLAYVPVNGFKLGLGVLLVIACAILLRSPERRPSQWGGRVGDSMVGFAGGILGGLAGLSGILPTLWAEVRGWAKDERRAVFQGYNFCILGFALVAQIAAGFFTWELAELALVAIPGTIVGAWIGRRLYQRLDSQRFGKVVLMLLMIAGLGLIGSSYRSAASILQ